MSGAQLRRARHVAARRGLEATLALNDWNRTCADLDYRCAYCGIAVSWGGTIDHFQPMARNGGTTITNCILSCTSCNQSKGACLPETFLAHRPERLARLRHYLAHRQPGQARQSFWTFHLPKEENHPMNKDTMRSTPHPLSSGSELYVYSDDHQTVLQFRQPSSDTDPLASCVQIGVLLTATECLRLAATLLSSASEKVVEKPAPVPELNTYPWPD